MLKKIIFSLILIGAIGGGIGFYMFNKPLQSTSKMKTDFTLSAVDLLQQFEEDEASANTKYLDKVIEVKGSVQKIEKKDKNITVYLDAESLMSSVIFQLENDETTIQKGEEVTLKGICTGYLMDVVLVRAVRV